MLRIGLPLELTSRLISSASSIHSILHSPVYCFHSVRIRHSLTFQALNSPIPVVNVNESHLSGDGIRPSRYHSDFQSIGYALYSDWIFSRNGPIKSFELPICELCELKHFKFHKLLRQQNKGEAKILTTSYSAFIVVYSSEKKDYENRSIFARVITKINVSRFLWPTV